MNDSNELPPQKSLHPDSHLNPAKLAGFDRLSTDVRLNSLLPGDDKGCLKTRRDGTILDRHHRIRVLRNRGVDVDRLPREISEKESEEQDLKDVDPATLA
jgi:hypothetical protein